jgi:uncharacterized membrane protein (UPF0182 family)
MTKPDDFYAKEDVWGVPINPTGEQGTSVTRSTLVDPTYLLITLPGETQPEFVLSRPFSPRARNNMIALMIARSDPGHYGEFLTLDFPSGKQVPGPIQVDNAINQDVEISQTLTLLRSGGSTVDFGALVILPVEDSILYVQPLFVTAESVGIPELKRVVLALGENVVMEETFEGALNSLFGLNVQPTDVPTPEGPGGNQKPPPTSTLQKLVAQAGQVYEQAQQALSDGDFKTYGRLIEKLGRIIAQAEKLAQ